MNDDSRSFAITLLLLLSMIWGTSFILIKLGLKGLDPDEVGALRVSAASLVLFPLALTKLKELRAHHYWKLLLSGLLGIFFPAFLFALAETRLDSSVTGIANSLTPLLTIVIGSLFFHQKFNRSSIFGILIGLGGTVILILVGSGGALGGANLYTLVIIVACILYATNLNFIKYKIPDLKALTITCVSLMLIGPLGILYLLIDGGLVHKLQTHPEALTAAGFVVLLGIMSTSVATILFNKLVKISTPLFTSSVTYIIPIVAVMWGLLDGERLYTGHFIGMAAIIGGVYLANRKK